MQKRQIFINAIVSVVQIIVISGILFVLYKFLLNTIGVEQLGIWSLVLATAAVTQIANFGFSGSVVKFVAKYIARRESRNVSGVIQTAAVSVSVFVGFVLLVGYPIIRWMIQNGFNKHIDITKLKNIPDDLKEWYQSKKMPENLKSQIKQYWQKKWADINNIDAPMSGIGTMADFGRFQMGVAQYFIDRFPEYEDEIEEYVYELGLKFR